MTQKPTEAAVFDTELFLWTDGVTKLNRKMGVWKYYDLSGELVIMREFDKRGEMITEQFFPPQDIDKVAVFSIEVVFEDIKKFSWQVIPKLNKNGEYNGILKFWARYLYDDDRALLQKDFNNIKFDRYATLWKKSRWILTQETGYKNGEIIWLKNYNKDGVLEFLEEYQSNEANEKCDEKIIEKAKQLVNINDKSAIQNYQEYLEMAYIVNQDAKDDIKTHKKATAKDVQAVENYLGFALPQGLQTFYRTYANGVTCNDLYHSEILLPTPTIIGVIDYFKHLQEIGFIPEHSLTKPNDSEHLQYLNEHYFVFAQRAQDANVFILLVRKDGCYFAIDYHDDYSNNIYNEYLQDLDNTPHSQNFDMVLNNFLRIEKLQLFNYLMENLERYDECVEYEEQEVHRLFHKKHS